MRFLFLITICILVPPIASAEGSEDEDIFNTASFDSSLTTSTVTDSANALVYLPGVALVAQSAATLRDSLHYGADSRFFGSVFIKASKQDVGALYAGCSFNYFLFAAADNAPQEMLYRYQSPDPETPDLAMTEFHFSTDINKRVFIRVGKQLIGWGASYFWSPTDFVNRERVQASVLTPIDIRTGKPGIRLHLPLPKANLLLFTDFSDITARGMAQSIGNHVAQAWRLDATIAGVNIGTVGYAGRNRPLKVGIDATGNVLATDIYTEAAFTLGREGHERSATALSIGASRLFGQEKNWTVRTEFYCNDTGYGDIDPSTLSPGSFTPLYAGNYYLYGELSGTKLASGLVDATIFGCVNLADGSYSPGGQCTIDLPGVVPFTLFTRYFGGREKREFTTPYGGNALQMGLRVMVML